MSSRTQWSRAYWHIQHCTNGINTAPCRASMKSIAWHCLEACRHTINEVATFSKIFSPHWDKWVTGFLDLLKICLFRYLTGTVWCTKFFEKSDLLLVVNPLLVFYFISLSLYVCLSILVHKRTAPVERKENNYFRRNPYIYFTWKSIQNKSWLYPLPHKACTLHLQLLHLNRTFQDGQSVSRWYEFQIIHKINWLNCSSLSKLPLWLAS